MEVCRLCLDLATASDVKKLEGTYKDATQIVLPELNTDISSSPVICQPCTSSLDELYAFKASVVEAEHQIKEKVGDDKCQLQLKEVMTGVKIDKDADLGKSKDRMCRTCLCAIEGETFTVLKPTQTDAYLNSMLLMCLPEMDLELTLDPVMCEQCLCHLQKLYHFKSSCLDVEERLNNYCQQHGTSSSNQINLHSVLEEDAADSKHNNFAAVKSEPIDSSVGDYKSEEDDEDVSMSDNSKDLGYTVVKVKKEERDMALKEEDDTEDGDESMGDDDGNITDEEIGELKQEELKIEDDEGDGSKKAESACCSEKVPSENSVRTGPRSVKCDHCTFTAKSNYRLKLHVQRKHQTGLPVLTCNFCDYTSSDKEYLGNHLRMNHTERPLLKCDHCTFTSKFHYSLKLHVKCKHQTGLQLLTCNFCDYTSSNKKYLRNHLRRNHTECPLLKCDRCPFTTKFKSSFRSHISHMHEDRRLVNCEYCDFTTKYLKSLRSHVKHFHKQEASPLENSRRKSSIKCEYCEFTTVYKKSMKTHVKDLHQQEKYAPMKCDNCAYTISFVHHFRKHVKYCKKTSNGTPNTM